MATVVSRLYADRATAESALDALVEQGFGGLDYDILSAPQGGDVLAKVLALGVLKDTAPAYVREIAAGRTLVVVRAPFGAASTADFVLDKFDPISADQLRQSVFLREYERRAMPLSGMTFLTGGNIGTGPAFASIIPIPTLTKSQKSKTKLLSRSTTPFQMITRIPTLTKSKTSKTKLTKDPTPFSSLTRMKMLIPYNSRTRVW